MSQSVWKKDAIAKVEAERRCRVCESVKVDPAHLWDRGMGGSWHPSNVIPLCRKCHAKYDHHELDILPYLKTHEQAQMVTEAGSMARAFRRAGGML